MLSNINKIGFIGCGKMGGAIISGVLKTGFNKLIGVEATTEIAQKASTNLGLEVTTDLKKAVTDSDIIFIALKPQYVLETLTSVKDILNSGSKLIVSVAAGVTTSKIEAILTNAPVIRAMPNTPALIGEGVFGIAKGTKATREQIELIKQLLSTIGECIEIDESKIDIVTALSGSGPAFFYKVINEMAKGAVELGLDYEKALKLSLKTAIGSAKMIEQSTLPVEQLISNVATKGGCTAVGVDYMNEINTEKIFAELIKVTTEKAASLG